MILSLYSRVVFSDALLCEVHGSRSTWVIGYFYDPFSSLDFNYAGEQTRDRRSFPMTYDTITSCLRDSRVLVPPPLHRASMPRFGNIDSIP